MNALALITATSEPAESLILSGLRQLQRAGLLTEHSERNMANMDKRDDPLHGCAPFEFRFGPRFLYNSTGDLRRNPEIGWCRQGYHSFQALAERQVPGFFTALKIAHKAWLQRPAPGSQTGLAELQAYTAERLVWKTWMNNTFLGCE